MRKLSFPYEVLSEIKDEEDLVHLVASFTPDDGIRIDLFDTQTNESIQFDFTNKQAKLIGAALIKWAERGHG